MKIFKAVILILFILGLLFSSFISGAIIEKFKLYPITEKLSLFLENNGLSLLRAKVKDQVTGTDSIAEKFIQSNYYDLRLIKHERPSYDDYGGIDILNGKLLYIDKKGLGWIKQNIQFKKIIKHPIQNNESEFIDIFGEGLTYSYGVKDILVVKESSSNSLYVSSTNFDQFNQCYFISVFKTEIDFKSKQIDEWSNVFNSFPCLKKHNLKEYAGTSAGGRLVHDEKNIYLSIGDFYFDGVNEIDITSVKNSTYGKLIQITKSDMTASVIASGLRNPQGLFIDKKGFFESEHGPQGGDEVNFISFDERSNKNFGWPSTSFGVDYGTTIWPLDPENNNFEINQSTLPIMTWIPSIGISNLIRFYSNTDLNRWDGDLIVSSLRDKSLFRIKLNGTQPILIERIELGFRIRDIIQDKEKIYIQDASSRYIWELIEKK